MGAAGGAGGGGAIALLGDVMLGRAVADALGGIEPQEVWAAELREIAASCDAVVCNLECCVSSRGERTRRVPGKPFFFRAPPRAISSLEAIGVGAVGLANNHALDHEQEALADSVEALRGAGIGFAGAGEDVSEARRGVVIEAGERRVGMVGVSDHPEEFAAADGSQGIAYADLRRGIPAWLADELTVHPAAGHGRGVPEHRRAGGGVVGERGGLLIAPLGLADQMPGEGQLRHEPGEAIRVRASFRQVGRPGQGGA